MLNPDHLKVYALDGVEMLGEIPNYHRLQVTEEDMDGGEWRIEVPLGDGGSIPGRWRDSDFPNIEVVDLNTGWRFGGPQMGRGTVREGTGDTTAWFSGMDFQGLLQGYLAWPNPLNFSEWWKNFYGGGELPLTTAAHNQLYFTLGPGASPFRLMHEPVGGFFVDDPADGPGPKWYVTGQPILELFRSWFTQQDWTFRFRLERDTSGAAQVNFSTPARETATKIFDAETGAVGRVETEERMARAGMAISMGGEYPPAEAPEPGARYVAAVKWQQVSWRYRHWETFRDRPADDDNDTLIDENNKWLFELLNRTSVQISDLEIGGTTAWGRDIDLGWYAKARVRAGSTITAPVVASTLTVNEGQARRTISVGAEALTPEQVLFDQAAALARRIARLERLAGRGGG